MPPSGCDPFPEAASCYPLKLAPSFRERVWGQSDLSFLYTSRPENSPPVGEVWLTADDNRVLNGAWAGKTLGEVCRAAGPALLGQAMEPAESPDDPAFPLLVKFLFTTDKLSVQVHPPDQYARETEDGPGKTEMWHVLKADPGARLAIGLQDEISRSHALDWTALKAAAESGAVEGMLNWLEVREGETFFIPAGTVHAIGAGLVLCEIQQNSDITYRLYDYNRPGADGRPRPLHVEKALDVIQRRSIGGLTFPLRHTDQQGTRLLLAACRYFATEKLALTNSFTDTTEGRFEIWIGLEGEAEFEAGGQSAGCREGEVVVMPANVRKFSVTPKSSCVFLRTYRPTREADFLAPLRAQGFSEQELSGVCFFRQPMT